MLREPLTKAEVKAAIERTGCERVPVMMHKWWGDGLAALHGDALERMAARFPDDICMVWHQMPGGQTSPTDNPHFRFGYLDDYSAAERHSIGQSVVLLDDWADLDRFLADFPNPDEPGVFDGAARAAREQANGRYLLGSFWSVFHERLWGIRGMENLMLDYYDEMDGLKRIGRALLDFHKVTIDRYAALGCDGIFTSDDLGHQTGPMMSPAIFEELYLPLYAELIAHAHAKGLHVFLHSCGDNTPLMPMLIEAGLDVFHPVQKGCMDMAGTARRFGRDMSFLAGMDVQHTLPNGSVAQVREEVRAMRALFHTPDGGLLLAAGNGIMPGTPLENIEAMLEEMCR